MEGCFHGSQAASIRTASPIVRSYIAIGIAMVTNRLLRTRFFANVQFTLGQTRPTLAARNRLLASNLTRLTTASASIHSVGPSRFKAFIGSRDKTTVSLLCFWEGLGRRCRILSQHALPTAHPERSPPSRMSVNTTTGLCRARRARACLAEAAYRTCQPAASKYEAMLSRSNGGNDI